MSALQDAGERLTQTEAAPLIYVLTTTVAARTETRALAIKGVVLAHHGLRAPRVSGDVDVIVHPDDLDRFLAGMESAGWTANATTTTPKLLEYHSVDLTNDHWPMSIDVHSYFPGFLAPADEVFDRIWARRVEFDQAGHPVPATDLVSSAVVAALHYLRHPGLAHKQAAMETLAELATPLFAPGSQNATDLVAFARDTGCVRPLTPFLERLGLPTTPVHPAEETGYERWRLATTADPRMAWWLEFRALPLRRRPAFLWYALMLEDEELRTYHGDRTVSTPLWRLRVERWKRVSSHLAGATRQKFSGRRQR
ncbi:nucleotidyltransferase family protein [Nocardioides gilvus]|uniref:nucleotidyltransferase family protein n=1 Tax=Nocardioides gilvus TaxID=1735589 RepID=UPI000D74281D|nr:nucleotidyltransferase family protein [Nocardioides gilvus]